MTSREKVRRIFERESDGAAALWTGHFNEKTIPIFMKAYGVSRDGGHNGKSAVSTDAEALQEYLRDDCRWFGADRCYKHPDGLPMLDPSFGIDRANSLSAPGCFANAETVADIEKYPWPDPKYLRFDELNQQLERVPDKMVFTGLSCGFFHNMCDFFGMEEYFVNMHLNPKVIEAATEHFVEFYVQANELCLQSVGDRADAIFMSNDFGTQRDLFISPELFRRFVLPGFKRIAQLGKKYGKFVILHSCGSIYRIIPDLIDVGVDVLHPIQAQAAGMSADNLAQFKKDIAFLGGIDAQSFFVNATPDEIKNEVYRVRKVLGPNIVISPSHEEILPNIPPENFKAMAEAALTL
ncbi:MAG: hypothetical protein LBS62_08780 [Clostridiales bacterium]|jgi:uroporphyrinogen decarboxylase|nr:hypothetical protein [Clostridiales bacterium]